MDIYSGWERYYQNAESADAWKENAEEAVDQLQRHAKSIRSAHVADLGCGDGRNAWPWLRESASMTCIDLSTTALQRIASRCESEGIASPTLLACDICATSLAPLQFDVVQCYDALPQVDHPEQALKEAARILKIGGIFGFNVFTVNDSAFGLGTKIDERSFVFKDTLFRFFSDEDVQSMLPDGMTVISCKCRRWTDPPHIPFRPWVHDHEALFYICERVS